MTDGNGVILPGYENKPWIHHRLGNIWPDEAMDVLSRPGFLAMNFRMRGAGVQDVYW